jgi:large subunit ribosomal protein L25
MKTVSISGSPRKSVGKKDAQRLRVKGLVPCVVYGGKEQIHFSTDERSFNKIIFTPEVCFVEIDLDGKIYRTILQDAQYHPTTDKIIHADFLELLDGKHIKLEVPVRLTGTSPGVLKGGKLNLKQRKLLVRALPANMPEEIVISIGKLDIGHGVKIKELKTNNFDLLQNDRTLVVQILKSRATDAATTEDDSEGETAETSEE